MGSEQPRHYQSNQQPLPGPSTNSMEGQEFKKKRAALSRWGQSRRPVATVAIIAVVVLVLVVVAAVLLQDVSLGPARARPPSFRLRDITDGRYVPRPINATWVSDYQFLYKDIDNRPVLYNMFTHTATHLIRKLYLIPLDPDVSYELSGDHRFLLVIHNKTQILKHSRLAQYEIVNIQEQITISLRNRNGAPDSHLLQLVAWIPKSSGLVYVYQNNIYYRPAVPAIDVEIELTNTGIPGQIYNGVTDFSYYGSIFTNEKALWISPDGKKIAFATFNDTYVANLTIPVFTHSSYRSNKYSQNFTVRYSKTGSSQPIVTLSVLNLETKRQNRPSTVKVPLPRDILRNEPILSSVSWINNDEIASVWLNRLQNKAKIYRFKYSDYRHINEILSISEDKGWVAFDSPPLFSWKGAKMVFIIPQEEHGIGEYSHIAAVHLKANMFKKLTRGNFSVTKIVGWDQSHHLLYFIAVHGRFPVVQHLYSVSDQMEGAPHNPLCLTCDQRTVYGNMFCLHNDASFSINGTYYILNCAGPDVPEISFHSRDNGLQFLWEDNRRIQVAMQRILERPRKIFQEVELPYGYKAQVMLILPPELNYNKNVKYPLLVHVDGAPGSSMVTNKFSVDWDTYLAGNRSYIIAYIDGRGSGNKGSDMLYEIYKNLGNKEVIDQIYVVRYLQSQYKFIDRRRIAIWGQNYGGYVTAMALMKDHQNIFKCGISVAPITDWMHYDSIYTERFMGHPKNEEVSHYVDSGLANKVENLRYKRFLLIHGTLNDVVHYEQSMMLLRALQQNDIQFQQQIYPDEDNTLSGVQPHLYHTMEKFLVECFE
ncbi:venom dipeptidyl peptidase 4-like isoform X1 [Schistocerca gregaria]|uniref:venom dipeptidyl peptidase 4-like isoform X1 n=1 Tax=Schistocerca gregaria TaxID=7010 RepID=UPI00211DCDD1|nr:venom dipeptidyl peptidase 4-like isoform X1 [Schistocerca gregaria]XP_049831371.1 venom dipeptidyl peptidase 4-like isoform X1 [Schistocerca gregaria]